MHSSKTSISDEIQLVIFRLRDSEYGLPISQVKEINRLVPITKLPETPLFIEGIINLREKILPVLDLRKRFHLPTAAPDAETRIIIVEALEKTVGIIVDAVAEVIRIASVSIEPPPPDFTFHNKYISGIGKLDNRLLIVLNMDNIISSQEISALP